MVVTRSMCRTTKKTTDTKIVVAKISTKQKRKTETTNKAKSGTTKIVDTENDAFCKPKCKVVKWTIMDDAFKLHMEENFLKYFERNPDHSQVPLKVFQDGCTKWHSMSRTEKYHYVKLFKKKAAKTAEMQAAKLAEMEREWRKRYDK